MELQRNNNSAGAWLGVALFSLLTGAAFDYGIFLMLSIGMWHGLAFIIVAIALARLSWVAFPGGRTAQLWITGLMIGLPLAFLMYLFLNWTPRFM